MIRQIGLWSPVFGFMGAVWFFSDAVSTRTPDLFSDKLLHALAYGCFAVAAIRAFHGGFRRWRGGRVAAALALTLLFGALDEWRQAGVIYRDASSGDWIADLVGSLVGWLAYLAIARRLGRSHPGRTGEGVGSRTI